MLYEKRIIFLVGFTTILSKFLSKSYAMYEETKSGGSSKTSPKYQDAEKYGSGPFQDNIGQGLYNADNDITNKILGGGVEGVVVGVLGLTATNAALGRPTTPVEVVGSGAGIYYASRDVYTQTSEKPFQNLNVNITSSNPNQNIHIENLNTNSEYNVHVENGVDKSVYNSNNE